MVYTVESVYIDGPLTVRLMCYNVDNDVLHGP